MNVLFLDTPAGIVKTSSVASFYEKILSQNRLSIIQKRLYDRFGITKGPHKTYTYGLLSIATVAKKLGNNVFYEILDDLKLSSNLNAMVIIADVVCFSCKTTVISQCIAIAKQIKNVNKDVKTVFGGPHPSFLPEDVLASGVVDVIVIGEGEETASELFTAIREEKSLKSIEGLAFLEGEKCVKTPRRKQVRDFNDIDFVDYSILSEDIGNYYIYLETRRGCQFNCSYCANPKIWGKKVRTLDHKNAYYRLKHISERLSQNSMVHISNPSFGCTEEDLALCALLKDNNTIFFSTDLCASFVTQELVQTMYDAGCRMFSIGIESASDTVLKLNNRPNFDVVVNALKKIKSTCDAFVKGYFVIGLPGETEYSARITRDAIINLLKEGLIDLVCEHVFVPYPGCDVFDYPEKYDYKIYSRDWLHYDSRSFPLPGELENFSMGKAYIAYIDLISTQCEFYGINPENYLRGNFNGNSENLPFLSHKKHLV